MKIRTRLTILFTLLTAAILLLFVAVIFLTARSDRELEFYALLKKEAVSKADLYLNESVDNQVLQDIHRNTRKTLNEVEVAIYNAHFDLLYHDASDNDFVKETPPMIEEISRKGAIQFYQGDWQVIGLLYKYRDKQFIITATGYDQHGYNKLNSLLRNGSLAFVVSILFIYLAGYYFSKKAFEPVSEMTEKARKISATNLDLRLATPDSKDELAELTHTFNEMLNRLEKSFDAQKQFVSNISHELRTPLAAIITELDLSASKERDVAQYKTAITNALSDARKLARLSNSLLDLAKASYDSSEISFKTVRIDEILLDARQQVQQASPTYKIDIHFEANFDDDNMVSIRGNEYLLKVAFANFFENGCKFSQNNQCTVCISFDIKQTILRFSDNGIGIEENDLKNIFTPFYRGENKKFAEGYGIGLSLTDKIITLHKGTISVTSVKNGGTTFTVVLPHL